MISTIQFSPGASSGSFFAAPVPSFAPPIVPLPPAPPASSTFLQFVPEEAKPLGLGLITGTAKVFLKDQIPAALGPVVVVFKAAATGEKLAQNIQDALDRGVPSAEAHVCETAQVLTEEVAGKILKGAVVGGIPAYLAAAVTSPPLAATIPIVVTQLPSAYQGAQTSAETMGNIAGAACRKGFALARDLAQGN